MENLSLIESFSEFKDEKFIDRVTLMSILEEVFRNTLKRKYGDDDNFDIIINPDKGDLEIWRNRIVVEDGAVEEFQLLRLEKSNLILKLVRTYQKKLN
jgi:N utilization substance protein A